MSHDSFWSRIRSKDFLFIHYLAQAPDAAEGGVEAGVAGLRGERPAAGGHPERPPGQVGVVPHSAAVVGAARGRQTLKSHLKILINTCNQGPQVGSKSEARSQKSY